MAASALLECLKDVVGLSKNPCPCLGDVPESESWSGLYVDDKSCGVPLGIIPKDCDSGSKWDFIMQAHEEGLRQFISDFGIALSTNRKNMYMPFSGIIGAKMPTRTIQNLPNQVGWSFKSCGVKGSRMKLNCVGLCMDCDELFDVELYASNQVDPIITVPIQAQKGKKVIIDLETPINLPMFDSKNRAIEYCLTYERNGCNPKDTKFWCGCSGAKPKFFNYLEMKGVTGDTKEDFAECKASNRDMYGLCLDVELSCGGLEWLCSARKEDWCEDDFLIVVAKTIQSYMIKWLAKSIANAGGSFQIQCDIKKIFAKQSEMNNAIKWRMEWLQKNIPADRTDCFECYNESGMTKQEVLI